MFPTEFTYAAPATLAEAVQLMQGADAKPLAGGQSLLPLMKLRLASPGQLVDLRRIGELRGIREDGDAIIIGAMTTYLTALKSPVLARRAPLVVEATRVVGDMQVRARGTIGGSLAHADPGGDMPAVMLALNADVAVAGPSGTRVIPVTSLFTGMMETAIQPNELLTAIRFQAIDTPDTGSAYAKHHHPASGYAVVGVAAIVRAGRGWDVPGGARRNHGRWRARDARDRRGAGACGQAAGRCDDQPGRRLRRERAGSALRLVRFGGLPRAPGAGLYPTRAGDGGAAGARRRVAHNLVTDNDRKPGHMDPASLLFDRLKRSALLRQGSPDSSPSRRQACHCSGCRRRDYTART